MVSKDEDALCCDMMETYHILDYRALPPLTAARLAFGLRDNSRVKMILSGQKTDTETTLLAALLDRVTWLAWAQTKDGRKNRNRPESVLGLLLGEDRKTKSNIMSFATGEDFEAYRQKLIERGNTNA